MFVLHEDRGWHAWAVRLTVILLTLATAYIHSMLGGLMFTANAAGYFGFAVLMALPLRMASRWRWVIRAALIAFTAATVVGWVLFGARFWLGYLDKGIEVALILLLGVEMVHYDGGPIPVARRAWRMVVNGLHRLTGATTTAFLLCLLMLLAGCNAGRQPLATPQPDAVIVSADGESFTQGLVSAPAGVPFTIYFEITDFSQHNLRLTDYDGTTIGATEVFAGLSARTLAVPALERGEYWFSCDFHPNMSATLEVW